MPLERQRGWTLLEAIRRAVDPELLRQYRLLPPIRTSPDPAGSGGAAKETKWQNVRSAGCFESITSDLRRYLVSGQLVGYGRHGEEHATVKPISSLVWQGARFEDLKTSKISISIPDSTIWDVRIVPALYAIDVVDRLNGLPIIEAFDLFVFNDPQVASLRKCAISRGGKPRNVGFQPLLYHAYWYTDDGEDVEASFVGFLSANGPQRHTRVAESALVDRFGRLTTLLREGSLTAHGVAAGQGVTVEIPRSMWLRPGAVLDLYKGDYFDRYPYQGDEIEPPVLPLYVGLTLQSPATRHKILHVKPTDDVPIRSSTVPKVVRGSGKGIQGANERRRVERECRIWLAEIMKESPNRRVKSIDELFTSARERWPGISERTFMTARSLAVSDAGAEAWLTAGAPRKSPR